MDDQVHVADAETTLSKAGGDGVDGDMPERVLAADETLLLARGDDLAIDHERRRGFVVELGDAAVNAEDVHR